MHTLACYDGRFYSFNEAGEAGEAKIYDAVKAAYANREALGFWRYPLKTKEIVLEPDLLLAEPELGLVVIEVKSLPINMLANIAGHCWHLTRPYYGKNQINAFEQARKQVRHLGELAVRKTKIDHIGTRALVALPCITRAEWDERFGNSMTEIPMLFADQLSPKALRTALEQVPFVRYGEPLDDEQWLRLCNSLGTSGNMPKRQIRKRVTPATPNKRSDLIARMTRHLHAFDLQQELIAKTIPPGPQRIRGIAGSGKTVLLAQKAANMHIRHPDWHIALVFFSRSLYQQIKNQVDHWLQEATNKEQSLETASHHLRILHAWGATEQPGFYRTLAEQINVPPLNAKQITEHVSPTAKLLYACHALLLDAQATNRSLQIFDAVLIDEGQDLVHENESLTLDEKQAFYWMAYQSLKPVAKDTLLDTGEPETRRLIWAYDEAQSLESMIIPSTKTLFGDAGPQIFGAGSTYKGGIKKSEIMHRCYRTPGPLLLAAHALGMGLLRPQGILAGLTNKKDWQAIGYEVEGQFRGGHQVTLKRKPENSPNPLPSFTAEPLIRYRSCSTRQAELDALVKDLQKDLGEHELQPSKHLLIVVLGQFKAVSWLQEEVRQALQAANISTFLPGNLKPNVAKQQYPNVDRNKFWCEGAVTIAPVMQAKGNEADVVYIVGLDQLAQQEDDLTLRNQLFVGMSRSRGWVTLSGVGLNQTTLGREIQEVLKAKDAIEFTYRKPKRSLDDLPN